MVRNKIRIRFSKDGDLRFLSHHDLLRCFERMLRRAELPFRSTDGFNPKPRLIFALSLALGIVGQGEIVELEFDSPIRPEEVRERLQGQCPRGLTIREALAIDSKEAARVQSATYRVPLPELLPTDLGSRCEAIRQAPLLGRTASTTAAPRRYQAFPARVSLAFRLSRNGFLGYSEKGSARPDEVLTLLGLGHLLHEGIVLERTALELVDKGSL